RAGANGALGGATCPHLAGTSKNEAALVVTTSSLPGGTKGVAYTATLAGSGGYPPYTWSRTAGSLPPGVSLFGGGKITGKPTAAGTYTFTVEATDAIGAEALRRLRHAIA